MNEENKFTIADFISVLKERIDSLEKRITEIEGKTADKTTVDSLLAELSKRNITF